jgi:hypothetical protein
MRLLEHVEAVVETPEPKAPILAVHGGHRSTTLAHPM